MTTPLVRERSADTTEETELELKLADAEEYRPIARRAAYLAQDRPDLQRATRELAKGLQRPTTQHQTQLKRLARYLRHAPRVVQRFQNQRSFTKITGRSDTDHAGCIRARESTSGGAIQVGNHDVLTYCRCQAVIALASGEAEYHGLASMSSELLGMKSMCLAFGILVGIEAFLDATTGIAI